MCKQLICISALLSQQFLVDAVTRPQCPAPCSDLWLSQSHKQLALLSRHGKIQELKTLHYLVVPIPFSPLQ